MHNLTADPEERHNRVGDATAELSKLQSILDSERDANDSFRASATTDRDATPTPERAGRRREAAS